MKSLSLLAVLTLFAAGAGPAMAQSCKAVSADGKPLAGAAKNSYVKKCMKG